MAEATTKESDPTHQAGGGLARPGDCTVKELNTVIMAHLEKIFKSQCRPGSSVWHKEQMVDFLHRSQADKVSDRVSADISAREELDFKGFLDYMTSSAANAMEPTLESDLTWPLSSYYISSSHNTYLTGNQLNSDSDADAYRNVLLRGCRCVEIDVWDGDDSDTETSESSESEDEEAKEKKAIHKASKREKLVSKLPGSLASRLSKKVAKSSNSKADGGEKTSVDPGTGAPPRKTPSPQAFAVEPRVLHGYTLTKEVSFREVCEAIRDNAFVVTDLPLIVSLEVHCSPQQQEAMVNIMNEVWAGLVLSSPPQNANHANILPSPGQLRRKILVKVKYVPPNSSTSAADEESSDRLPPPTAADPNSKASNTSQQKVQKASKIIQALSAFGVYTRGVSFKSLSQPEATMPTHIFSLSENGVAEVHENEAPRLFEHNRQYLMRTYPSGMRIGSSNLDPPVFWRKGIQIVALNWQKWDEGMMLNEGMFAGTGGYVLKPEGYRGKKVIGEISESQQQGAGSEVEKQPITTALETPSIQHQTLDLSITVYAAQNLPLPEEDDKASGFRPYVKVEVHTEPPHSHLTPQKEGTKAKEGEYKAKTKSQRGLDPDFGAEPLTFVCVPGVVPELAFVRFLVKDDEIGRDDLAAWACIRLDRLRGGYRLVHLFDNGGNVSGGVILVQVQMRLS
ncbi:PLC-like phosphodiesterase [Biscogniauxia marginata]|nr:PLC-like phosphodiesterase [Biscogniauxia marginata]